MNYFRITFTKETIERVEEFFRSPVLSSNRSIRLHGVYHEAGYSVAQIVPEEGHEKMKPEDIFWRGFHCYPAEITSNSEAV